MTKRSVILGIGVALGTLAGVWAASPMPNGTHSSHPTAVPSVSPSPSPGVGLDDAEQGESLLNPLQAAQLSKEFAQALATERLALNHRQKFELLELKASQDARLREWKAREAAELKRLRAQDSKPAEIRTYVRDRNVRYDGFRTMLKDERKDRVQAQQVRMQSLKNDQDARRKEFEAYLKKGEIPPNRLWPRPGQ